MSAGERGRAAGWFALAVAIASLAACGRSNQVEAPSDASREEGSDASAPLPLDARVAHECTPGVRACIEGPATRLCSEQGRWLPGERCGAGSACSGGACVCAAGACEDGMLLDLPGFLIQVVAGGDVLHYMHAVRFDETTIHSFDLRTGMPVGVERGPVGHEIVPALGADAAGAVYWCRRPFEFSGSGLEAALMRGAEVLVPGVSCSGLQVTSGQVIFTLDGKPGLFRWALRPTGGGPRETITEENPWSFAVTDSHAYVATRDNGRERSLVEAIALDDLTRARPLAERVGDAARPFDRMAADASYVYVSYDDQILRTAVAGGDGTFQTVWSGEDLEIDSIVLSATHVYWAAHAGGAGGCTETTFWRRSKLRDEEPVVLARRGRVCPFGLVLWGDRVYAGVSGPPDISQILRLRQ